MADATCPRCSMRAVVADLGGSSREPNCSRATVVTPQLRPSAPWRVEAVTALPGNRLSVRFVDGLTGCVDLSALLESPQAGVFACLRDPAVFAQVRVELGAVTWPGGLDLAPDAMHVTIKQCGEWQVAP